MEETARSFNTPLQRGGRYARRPKTKSVTPACRGGGHLWPSYNNRKTFNSVNNSTLLINKQVAVIFSCFFRVMLFFR